MKIQFKGPAAVVLLAAILAGGLGLSLHSDRLNEAAKEELEQTVRRWLSVERGRQVLPRMEEMMKRPSPDAKALEALSERLSPEAFRVLSMDRHGRGRESVVKVEYADPEGKRRTRYLRVRRVGSRDWMVEGESTALGWWLSLF